MLNAKSDNELIEIIKSFDGFSDVDMLIEEFLMHWLPVEVTQERKNLYVNLLLDGIEKADWAEAINNNNVANGVRALITAIIKSPDFQLT